MSPTVPPISMMARSTRPFLGPVASSIMRLISSVTCGITCTVLPR